MHIYEGPKGGSSGHGWPPRRVTCRQCVSSASARRELPYTRLRTGDFKRTREERTCRARADDADPNCPSSMKLIAPPVAEALAYWRSISSPYRTGYWCVWCAARESVPRIACILGSQSARCRWGGTATGGCTPAALGLTPNRATTRTRGGRVHRAPFL